jgi:hypothetical protein
MTRDASDADRSFEDAQGDCRHVSDARRYAQGSGTTIASRVPMATIDVAQHRLPLRLVVVDCRCGPIRRASLLSGLFDELRRA